jgi:hypothetical protein
MRPVRDDPLSHRAGCTRLCGDDELYRAVLATLSQREHRAAKAEQPTSGRSATPADFNRNGGPTSIGTGGRHHRNARPTSSEYARINEPALHLLEGEIPFGDAPPALAMDAAKWDLEGARSNLSQGPNRRLNLGATGIRENHPVEGRLFTRHQGDRYECYRNWPKQ